eukprot:1680997-Rhodomonas_salina.1
MRGTAYFKSPPHASSFKPRNKVHADSSGRIRLRQPALEYNFCTQQALGSISAHLLPHSSAAAGRARAVSSISKQRVRVVGFACRRCAKELGILWDGVSARVRASTAA